jgi:hypothetical protein
MPRVGSPHHVLLCDQISASELHFSKIASAGILSEEGGTPAAARGPPRRYLEYHTEAFLHHRLMRARSAKARKQGNKTNSFGDEITLQRGVLPPTNKLFFVSENLQTESIWRARTDRRPPALKILAIVRRDRYM